MKKYSSARAGRGKTAYRTPSVFKYKQIKEVQKRKVKVTRIYESHPNNSN